MKAVTISLSPNAQKQDIFKTFLLLFTPWNYLNGESIKALEQWFRQYFNVSYAISFSSGRGALYAILKSLGASEKDEVILQAFTCMVVPNAIVALGLKPIYVDVTDSFTMDPNDLKKKITQKTKAIIVQHTFGIPADMREIFSIAKEHNIPIIEDCAHTIGGEFQRKKLGTFGIASFFSFGRDKAFSSVFGGMAITNDEEFGKKLRTFEKQLPYPSASWVLQQLIHPIAFSVIIPCYSFLGIGKVLLVVLQKLHAISFPVQTIEKEGKVPDTMIRKLPNVLAALALLQLRRIKEFNNHREELSRLYIDNLKHDTIFPPVRLFIPFLRFPILVETPDQLMFYARKHNVYLGRWYADVIDPKGSDLEAVSYRKGMCPNAEKLSKYIINLPTNSNTSKSDAQRVISVINSYAADTRNNQ